MTASLSSIMVVFYLLALAGFCAAHVLPRAAGEQSPRDNTVHRVEWRDLSSAEQQSYIDGVLCLKTKPSRLGLNTTLFDDFAYVHHNLNAQSKTIRNLLFTYIADICGSSLCCRIPSMA